MKRGELWLLEEPDKRRPVCILTRDEAIPVLTSVVVVAATTNRRGAPSEMPLDVEDGVAQPCVLSFDNILTAQKARLTQRLGSLPAARMNELCDMLALATDC